MADIITLGELLIDLTQKGVDENGCGEFTAYPGGAPANVAVAASRLGAKTAFVGKVGRDAFGRSLADTLIKEGVDTSGLYFDDNNPTTLAIVSVDPSGERDFAFYRDPGADTQLTADEAVRAIEAGFTDVSWDNLSRFTVHDIKNVNMGGKPLILHVGSLSLTTSPSREACEEAIRAAKSKGMLISYDPNYREALWDSKEHAVEMMKSLLQYTDILKVSDDEMEMLTGTGSYEEGSRILQSYGIFLVMVTLGADGVFVRCGEFTATVQGYSVKVADTNGAGDTFLGAMLMQIAERIRKSESGTNLKLGRRSILDMVRTANKAASLTCSRSGAIPAMPTAAELSAAE